MSFDVPRRLGVALALVGALSFANEARAGGSIEDAKQWVAEGDKAQDAGDCPTAITKYRQALGVKETAPIFLRLGACQETVGKLGDALVSYRAAKPLANDKTVAGLVDEKIAAISPKVPGITFVLPADRPAEMHVAVDGVEVPNLATEVPVNPGKVRVTADATGMAPFVKILDVSPGLHQRVDVILTPATEDTPPKDTAPSVPGPKPSIPGIVLGAVGVVGIGVGIGLVVRGFDLKAELDDACGKATAKGYVCPPDAFKNPQAVVDESNSFQIGGFVALGIGGAAATVGGVLLGLSLTAKPSEPPPVAIVPVVDGRFAGAFAVGAF